MGTDHPIYLFLSTGAEAFRVLTDGQTLDGDYRFASLTLKTLERRLDAVFEPEGHPGTVYVVEFQAQAAPKAWYNLVTKIGLYGEAHPERDLVGILVLLRERDVPLYPTRLGSASALAIKVALDRVLPGWLAREPANPYVAALAPLVILDEPALRAQAPTLWQTVRTATVSDETRETLSEVLEFWFFERFRGLTAKEIWAMLNLLTPIEETRAYQSIFAEGEAKGKAEGKAEGEAEGEAKGEAKAKASTLQRLLMRRFGPLPRWAEERIRAASVAQLDCWLDGLLDATSLEGLLGAGG